MKLGFFPYNTVTSGKERNVWLMSAHSITCVYSFLYKGHSYVIEKIFISVQSPQESKNHDDFLK